MAGKPVSRLDTRRIIITESFISIKLEETKSVLSSYSIRMPKEKIVLSVDDFVRFDVAFQDDAMFRLLFRVAFVGGLRISETIGLQVSSFYPDRNSLLINRQACDYATKNKPSSSSGRRNNNQFCSRPFLAEKIIRVKLARLDADRKTD